MVALGFSELAPDVGQAADGGDVEVVVTLTEGLVGSQTVALKVALK